MALETLGDILAFQCNEMLKKGTPWNRLQKAIGPRIEEAIKGWCKELADLDHRLTILRSTPLDPDAALLGLDQWP